MPHARGPLNDNGLGRRKEFRRRGTQLRRKSLGGNEFAGCKEFRHLSGVFTLAGEDVGRVRLRRYDSGAARRRPRGWTLVRAFPRPPPLPRGLCVVCVPHKKKYTH